MNDLTNNINVPADRIDLPEIKTLNVLPSTMSTNIDKFCNSIGREFNATAAQLRQLANEMRKLAEIADQKADQLESAAPNLADQVSTWVRFERDAHQFFEFYRTIIPA